MPTLIQAEQTTLNYANTPSVNGTNIKASAKKRRFQDIFPRLKVELVEAFKASNMPNDATEWFDRVSIRRRTWNRAVKSIGHRTLSIMCHTANSTGVCLWLTPWRLFGE